MGCVETQTRRHVKSPVVPCCGRECPEPAGGDSKTHVAAVPLTSDLAVPPARTAPAEGPHSASMSREVGEASGVIGDHVPVDDLRELSLEAPEGFGAGLALGELAAVVIPPRSGMHDLNASGKVKGVVERAVPASRKAIESTPGRASDR